MNTKQLCRAYVLREQSSLSSKIKPNCQIILKHFENYLMLELLYMQEGTYCSIKVFETDKANRLRDIIGLMEWCLDNNKYPNGNYYPSDFDELKTDIEALQNTKNQRKTTRKN